MKLKSDTLTALTLAAGITLGGTAVAVYAQTKEKKPYIDLFGEEEKCATIQMLNAKALFASGDLDKNGSLSEAEFFALMKKMAAEKKPVPAEAKPKAEWPKLPFFNRPKHGGDSCPACGLG